MAFTGPIEDRIAIREMYDTYADGANRMDRETWLSAWADDGVWKTHYFEVTGKAEIGAKYDELMAPVTATTFLTQICSIEVDGDTARASAVGQERLMMPGGSFRLTGLNKDKLIRRDGQWQILRRDYLVSVEEAPGVGEVVVQPTPG
jgi:ketosteroid isomerase-like protein